MSNQLVTPVFYVYKLTFQSGNSYVGFHKQKKLNDNYITSSSYYKKHPEDRIISRDILFQTDNEHKASFIETWCILSDKAYNPKSNVNYNLGNFFHKFSTGYRTPEELKIIAAKTKHTMSLKSPEELKAIIEKQKHTMSLKSPEELADIHRRQGYNSHGIPHKVEWWNKLSNEEKLGVKRKMSKARSEWYTNASDKQIEQFKQKCSNIRKAYFENMTEDDLNRFKQKCKARELKRWENASEEERFKRCKGFYEASEERKQKVRCVETNEVFNSAKEAAAWIGPKAKGCNITAQARGHLHFAYRHPITNEPLHWELV